MHYKRMRVLVGGDSSRLWEVTFDKKEMKEANPALAALVDADFMEMVANLDEGKMYLRVISNGNWMAVVAGEPKLLGRMRRALSQPSAFNPNLDHIGADTEGDLVMAMSLDLRSLFNGMLAYVHAHPSEIKKEWRSMNARNVISQLKPIPGPPAAMSMSVASATGGSVMSSSSSTSSRSERCAGRSTATSWTLPWRTPRPRRWRNLTSKASDFQASSQVVAHTSSAYSASSEAAEGGLLP